MSLFKEEHLECPSCHKTVPFIMHSSINVGTDPELKEKVLNRSIFKYQCPHCKETGMMYYPLLYHDPENKIMIRVLWREEDFGRPVEKKLQTMIELMEQKNYRRRTVFGIQELAEKIYVFDAGLNDFAISLLKAEHKIEKPDVQTFFAGMREHELYFAQMKDGKLLPDCLIYPESFYEAALKYAELRQKPHPFYEYLRVDESCFHDELMALINKKTSQNE